LGIATSDEAAARGFRLRTGVIEPEEERAARLLDAQYKAERLFAEIESRGLIQPGGTERELNAAIHALAKELFGISTYWHKRIVRAGSNTLQPYGVNPPNLTIAQEDILFLDFGPIFDDWEADFGRTYVVGSDPVRKKLRDDVGEAFALGKQFFNQSPDITARDLFNYALSLAERFGWEFGGRIAGHLIGQFPHERIADDKISLYIHPENDLIMRSFDEAGHLRHWILEIHFVDRTRRIGGFYEELLTL
jgi:Xaa-Pro aminopeptidase